MIYFTSFDHKYKSIDNSAEEWTSCTKVISKFHKEFNKIEVSEKASKNRKSKWFKMSPEEIREVWDKESKRSIDLGNFYHNEREKELLSLDTIQRYGKQLNVFQIKEKDGIKYAPEQKLEEGIYPEHMVYLKTAGICGQSDLVEVVNGEVFITDYKTCKEISVASYVDHRGVKDKMYAPISHIDNSNYWHYAIQLSLYMYMILQHNPQLKPGKMTLQHVKFEVLQEDRYGYPIHKLDNNGDPIVQEIENYDVPYLYKEVVNIINYLKK